jgi:hypothetical protein
MEFFCDPIDWIAIQKRFQLRLLFWRGRQFSDVLQIRLRYGVDDEDRFDGGKIEAVDIGSDVAFCMRQGHRWLFAARLPIKGKRFPGEFVIAPVNFARTKV